MISPASGKKINQQLSPDHVVRRISILVDHLDLDPLIQLYQDSKRSPFDPIAMLKVVLYEIHQRNLSPARWHRDSRESLPVLWLLGGLQPGRTTFYEFQQRFDPIIDQLNANLLKRRSQPKETRQVAIDGTLIAANSTRHKLFNKQRLNERLGLLRQNLEGVMTETPRWLAPTLRGKMRQRDTYRRALRPLEEPLKKNAKLPANRRKPENKVLISPADCEAAFGRDKQKTYRPLYNTQLARDLDDDWILGHDVLATTSDAGTLEGTFDRCGALSGAVPTDALTDAGYATERDLIACERRGVTLIAPYRENTLAASSKKKSGKRHFKKDVFEWGNERKEYRCPNGVALKRKSQEFRVLSDGDRLRVFRDRCEPESCLACPQSSRYTSKPEHGRNLRRSEREDLVDALKVRMSKPESQQHYKKRAASIERCFGDMKANRNLTRFSRRGLRGAKTTVGLWTLLHNGLLWLDENTKNDIQQKIDLTPPDW